jgi:tetratricopeptide (TPR) repeat protein
VPFVQAQEEHHHHDGAEKIGTVHFPISCRSEVKQPFERAVALLYSFAYEDAERAFSDVAAADPECAMAYWGIAMTHYHPLWAAPPAEELKKGSDAVAKAKTLPNQTEREKAYVAAMEAFYKDSDKIDHRTRAVAFCNSMEKIYTRFPEDQEAAVFYALALNATALPTDKTFEHQKKAIAILEKVRLKNPDHPGVYHYIIHNCDYPALANLGLPAARSYAKIAPSVPHALHMPSHIFTRLGLWDESIDSNLAAEAAGKVHVASMGPGAAHYDSIHAMDYLEYAYLQKGQDTKAREILDQLQQISKVDVPSIGAGYAFVAIPARYAVERHKWADAAAIKLGPDWFPFSKYPYAEANLRFARGMGLARSGDVTNARKDLEGLEALHTKLLTVKDVYDWASAVEIQRLAVAAWIARAEKKDEEALKLMRASADLEDSTDKHPVTPGAFTPARELLGEMLLELNQPGEALMAFETSLKATPNRLNGLYGAARAAELAGDPSKAHDYYTKLMKLTEDADGERPELQKAKAFLAKK